MKEERDSLTESILTQQQNVEVVDSSSSKKDHYESHLPKLNGSNIFSYLFFGWVYPLIAYGARKTVKVQTMPTLKEEMKSWKEFECIKRNFETTSKSQKQGFTLVKILAKTYYRQFLTVLLFVLTYVTMEAVSPYLTAVIMRYIGDREGYPSYFGGLIFALTILLQVVRSVSNSHLFYRFSKLGISMTNNLTLLIFSKSLKYPSVAEKQFREADIINYSQVDAERMLSGGFQIAGILIAPIQVIVGIILMYNFIGVAFLAGLATLAVSVFFTYFTTKWSYRYNQDILKKKDERMKVTQQMLDIIRYIKINSIEKYFYGKVESKRMQEIKFYKKKGLMDVLNIFIFWLACPLILSATFMTYTFLGNQMTSEVAFTTMMIFTSLQYPIRLIPYSISALIQMFTSIKRIQKFLQSKEIKIDHIHFSQDPQLEFAISIQRGNFSYAVEKEDADKEGSQKKDKKQAQKKQSKKSITKNEKQQQTNQSLISKSVSEKEVEDGYVKALKDIETTIKRGSFTVIIGDIGSGKSSLLMALLNQMIAQEGSKIQINGRIAYSAQKPWIMSASVKENITFESPYIQSKFKEVIRYASLEQDLKILPDGVDTQIGEKGINISGGQKARISLARALYSDRDIYLFDDVLSAVDVHVGDFLMRETLKGYLKGKTILMPTHAIKYLEVVDEIIVMQKGRIVRKGRYEDICDTPEFTKIYLKEKKKSEEAGEDENKSQASTGKTQVVKDKQQIIQGKAEAVTVTDQVIRQLMLPQDQQVGEIDFKIFKQYIKYNGGYIGFALPIVIAMTLWISFTIGSSIILQRWCEDPVGQGYDLYIYIGLIVGSNLFILFRAYKLVMAGTRQGEVVHRKMMKALLYASLGNFFNRIPVGRIINRLTKDLRELDQVIGFKIGNLIVDFFLLIGTVIICAYASTFFVIIPVLVVAYVSQRFKKYYMKTQIEVSRYQKSTNSPIVSGFLSAISGLSSIRAYRMAPQFTQKQIKHLDVNKRVRLTKNGIQSWFSMNLTYMSFTINIVSLGYCILSDNPNASLAGLLMNYIMTLSTYIVDFTSSAAAFQSKVVSLERIYSFIKIQPEAPYTEYCQNWSYNQEGFQQVIPRGQIQFRGLYARYRSDLPDVLKGINLNIRAGEKIGIVGRTGAGKTTIINTLLMITQVSQGELLIDGTRIQDYLVKNLRFGITMIDQEPTLIKSTFKENLDITGKYSDEELYQILRDCNLYDTIMEKGGLEAAVSNDSLSAGEKQLLCICRAFLKHSKIVLVDEATANIDVKNDAIIQRVIAQKFRDCTVLTIAHRLSTLAHSDRILVLEKGEVVEFGSPAELQRKEKGWYKDMVEKNSKEFLI